MTKARDWAVRYPTRFSTVLVFSSSRHNGTKTHNPQPYAPRGQPASALTGNIAHLGRQYLLTLEATDCASGRRITGVKAGATSKQNVLAALDFLVDRVRSGLGESSRSLASYQVPILTDTTSSLEALESYSTGVDMDLRGKLETESLPFFQRAVELDPQFSMAMGRWGWTTTT